MTSNPARGADLPPEQISEQKPLPTFAQISQLIERLKEPVSTAVWLVAVSCVRPEELAFKWKDMDAEKRMLWVVRAVNQGKLHTPKYHRTNRPIRLTGADVNRLLALKAWSKAQDEDWVFPNRLKTGPIWHETLLARRIQPVARDLAFRTSRGVFSSGFAVLAVLSNMLIKLVNSVECCPKNRAGLVPICTLLAANWLP